MNPCGQVVGMIDQVESCRAVMYRLINEYLQAYERLAALHRA